MIGPTLLLRVRVPGRAVTGNPSRNGGAERLQFRRRVQYAVRAAFWTRPVPQTAPLSVRIEVRRPCGTRGDATTSRSLCSMLSTRSSASIERTSQRPSRSPASRRNLRVPNRAWKPGDDRRGSQRHACGPHERDVSAQINRLGRCGQLTLPIAAAPQTHRIGHRHRHQSESCLGSSHSRRDRQPPPKSPLDILSYIV